jgi:Zn-dependent M16 (insulinase) family peptidase
LTDEIRKTFKENILSVTRSQVMDTAKKYFLDLDTKGTVGVVSGADKVKEFNAQSEEVFEIHEI